LKILKHYIEKQFILSLSKWSRETHREIVHKKNKRHGSEQNKSQYEQSKTNEILNEKYITKQKLEHTVNVE